MIVDQVLTDANVDDASVGIDPVEQAPGRVCAVICDGAYDTRAFYEAAASRGASVVVPPIKTAQIGGNRCRARDRVVRRVRKTGRQQWQKESGYHRQARAENTFFSYKRILGNRLHARDADAQSVEARLACNILNRMAKLGMPASYADRMCIGAFARSICRELGLCTNAEPNYRPVNSAETDNHSLVIDESELANLIPKRPRLYFRTLRAHQRHLSG
ncbi:MAG: transposase [Hyphomicrobiaceae bacterium]|jgi:transposase